MQIFSKYVNHARMNEHIFENLCGEKPHMSKGKLRSSGFANGVLNSYK